MKLGNIRVIGAAIALAMMSAPAAAQVTNGNFGNATGWTLVGNVEYATVGAGATVALFQEPGEGTKPGAGSRARIFQSNLDFTGKPSIIFRYRLSVGTGTRDAAVPPDSFTAALYDMTAQARLAPALSTDVPDFSNGFYYTDSDGAEVFDSSIVSVTGPDGNGMKTVTLDLSTLTLPTAARLEFGFASADNGVTSAVFLDDVESDCTSSTVYCCSTATPPVSTAIDDGKPCTLDECQTDGSVTHDLFDCCGACDDNRPETAIFILVDVGETMPATELTNSKNAILEMLNRMRNDPNRPYIGFGTYGEGITHGGHERLPTTDYDVIEGELTQVVQLPSGPSGLGSAIDDAAGHLLDQTYVPASARKYILVFTDGFIDRPRYNPPQTGQKGCWPGCCPNVVSPCNYCICSCDPARDAAETAADTAESSGIQVFVAHYLGDFTNADEDSGKAVCDDDVSYTADAITWLESEIATTPDHMFKNTHVADALVDCVMTTTVELINCDDLDNCTTDSCIQGLCTHTPIAGCTP